MGEDSSSFDGRQEGVSLRSREQRKQGCLVTWGKKANVADWNGMMFMQVGF